jgi:hypothetical protein
VKGKRPCRRELVEICISVGREEMSNTGAINGMKATRFEILSSYVAEDLSLEEEN